MPQIQWTGIAVGSANVALNYINRKTENTFANSLGKRCQVSGPATGTWSAVVKFYRSEDQINDVLAATSVTISNTTPADITELLSQAIWWNFSVESVTGTIPAPGLTITVGG